MVSVLFSFDEKKREMNFVSREGAEKQALLKVTKQAQGSPPSEDQRKKKKHRMFSVLYNLPIRDFETSENQGECQLLLWTGSFMRKILTSYSLVVSPFLISKKGSSSLDIEKDSEGRSLL
ncbi:Hypothetical protein NTJ_00642 [Nesidiocoris tenuis]|uniref:Uncharacterized protein n=1 Tax=Nesidiocoris tenuis TaxID=355587 RepID=A0ABN7A6K7_9HEMI|nr:Hypothetical protein NTJ_00642 [Nesidiocoris tenuis]